MNKEISEETRERLRKAISLGSKSAKKLQKHLDSGIDQVLEEKAVRQIEKLQGLLETSGVDGEKLIHEFDKLWEVLEGFKNLDLSTSTIHKLILCLFDFSGREEELEEIWDSDWRHVFFDIFENSPRISEATLNFVLDVENIDKFKVDNPFCTWSNGVPFYFRGIALNPATPIDILMLLQKRAESAADFQLLLNPTSPIRLVLSLEPHSVTTHILSGESTVENEFPEIFKFLKSRIKLLTEEHLTGTLMHKSEVWSRNITPIDLLVFSWRISEYAKSNPDEYENLLISERENVLLHLISSTKNMELDARAPILQSHFPEPGLLDVTAFNKAIEELVQAMFSGSFSQFPYA